MNALNYGFFGICWERLMIDNVLMKVISQKITASCSAMPVINCKECGLDSIFVDVQDDTDSIFIVIS
jgi:hypothetical protein